jgi:hypothetical protein
MRCDVTVRSMSPSVVLDLAERYGVSVRWFHRRTEIQSKFLGPSDQGCDPATRTLYFNRMATADAGIEHYLHELVHVITQPPWLGINETPEELVLFQFERALARATFERWAYDRVVDWQEETSVYKEDYPVLAEEGCYQRTGYWRLGFAIARRVGLLDARNRPTFLWPQWERLRTPEVASILHFFDKRMKASLPRIAKEHS